MIINILPPKSFSEIGLKDNQEDFLWPSPTTVTPAQRVFIMCDGVGGQDSGEVASQTAGTALGEYLTSHWPEDGIVTKDFFNDALAHAYEELDKVDTGTTRKMGTTMTCIVIHRGGVLIAHIGDSRVYHIRPAYANAALEHSGVVYQTEDHSLVNDLLRVGEITEEEAVDFPQKNVITRAMQPNQERRSRADIYNVTDVQEGDYFFLCCDGVLEKLDNLTLGKILADTRLDNNAKIAAIKEICDSGTRDNYTCWLVPIGRVTPEDIDSSFITDDEDISLEASAVEEEQGIDYEVVKAQAARVAAARASQRPAQASRPARTNSRPAPRPVNHSQKEGLSTGAIIAIALAVVAVAGAVFAYFMYFKQPDRPLPVPKDSPEAPAPDFDVENKDVEDARPATQPAERRDTERPAPAERRGEEVQRPAENPAGITPEEAKEILEKTQPNEKESNKTDAKTDDKKSEKEGPTKESKSASSASSAKTPTTATPARSASSTNETKKWANPK